MPSFFTILTAFMIIIGKTWAAPGKWLLGALRYTFFKSALKFPTGLIDFYIWRRSYSIWYYCALSYPYKRIKSPRRFEKYSNLASISVEKIYWWYLYNSKLPIIYCYETSNIGIMRALFDLLTVWNLLPIFWSLCLLCWLKKMSESDC